jgi:pyridoxine kinase
MPKKILTIAGSDTLSGGGLQADLATFSEYGLFGMTAITSIVTEISDEFFIHPVNEKIFVEQLQTLDKFDIAGIKIGLLPTPEIIFAVEKFLQEFQHVPVVLDPVLVFKETGDAKMNEMKRLMVERLFPFADIVTPNLVEAQLLSETEIHTLADMEQAAKIIHSFGPRYVVIKGGARAPGNIAVDVLFNGSEFVELSVEKIQSVSNNGAGCTFSSSIASNLVLGLSMDEAVRDAKEFVYAGIQNGIPLTENIGNVWQGARRFEKNTAEEV